MMKKFRFAGLAFAAALSMMAAFSKPAAAACITVYCDGRFTAYSCQNTTPELIADAWRICNPYG
jgi:hypothetical protein